MTVLKQLKTAGDFWSEMVVPDCNEFDKDQTDLRKALHAAISLFHMHDWVFHTYTDTVKSTFTYTDNDKNKHRVSKASQFATSLEQRNHDFGRIRGIANAAKHLQLTDIRPVSNAPSHAANTALQITGYGQGGYGHGPYGGGGRVMLAGPDGNDMEFSLILQSVYEMWARLKQHHDW